ncbi:MAG: pseudouridylate synthase [Muribaculaceae bacterium]|nr:pseudouridylate synthase [Muribaculaceae bacterium]
MNWDFEKIDTRELLPQQPPFVMVDKLMHFDETVTTTTFEVRADNIFVDDGTLNACALAENIAQTCATRLGFVNKYILKRAIQLGFIGSIRNMQVMRTPSVGEKLTTTITVREQIMGLTLVDATILVGEETIVTAEMKIALSDQEMP